MSNVLRQYLDWNSRISRWQRSMAARVIPHLANDGARVFHERVLQSLLSPGLRVLDVGGGKHPGISLQTKQELGLHIVGLDISDTELVQAPAEAYNDIVVGDVATVNIPGQYDLIFSRSVMEHVQDPASAIKNLSRVLAPGGTMAHFMPCRNAPFAVINRCLGNQAARRLLFTVYPHKRKDSGFQAFYDRCTPSELSRVVHDSNLEVVNVIPYYRSDYASFFAPFYAIELLRQGLMCYLNWEDYAETFAIIVRNPRAPTDSVLVPVSGIQALAAERADSPCDTAA